MDDGSMQLVAIVILVAMSGLFSATETAFLSFNKVRMKNLASDGDRRAALVMKLSEIYDSLLSTILIGNNIVNIALASIMTLMFVSLDPKNGAAISTAVSTVIVLIFGEVTPKSLAKEFPDAFTKFIAPFINALVIIFTPLNLFFKLLKWVLRKLIGAGEDTGITEDELMTIVEEAEQDGGINENEGNLIRSAIEFDDAEVVDIITPRVEIIAVDKDDDFEKITATFLESGYSRLPVYDETIDNVIGVLHEKDFYHLDKDSVADVSSILRRALYVPCHIKISKLLSRFQQEKAHMAIVVDDYGGTLGLVTLEDVLEELVGDIWDEHDEIVQLINPELDGSITVEGGAKLYDVFEYYGIDPENEDELPQTVNGYVLMLAGEIPEIGSEFEGEGLKFTVRKTDGKLIEQVSVVKPEPEPEQEPDEEKRGFSNLLKPKQSDSDEDKKSEQ